MLGYSCKKGQQFTPKFTDTLTLTGSLYVPTTPLYANGVQVAKTYGDSVLKKIQDYGYYISINGGPAQKVSLGTNLMNNNKFNYLINDLKPTTTYTIKGYIYIYGQTHYAPTITFTTYAGTWKKLNDFPGNETDALSTGAKGFAVNGKGYVMFANGNLWQYNVANDSWAQKNKFAPTVNNPGYDPERIFFTINTSAYVYYRGGIYKYDDGADNWAKILQRDTSITSPGKAFVVNNKAYIMESYADPSSAQYSKVYDPATNTLQTISMYTKVNNPSGFATDQHIYINTVQSFYVGSDYQETWPAFMYNPADNSFTKLAANYYGALAARYSAVNFTIDGKAYIGEGVWGQTLTSYYIYKEGDNYSSVQPINSQYSSVLDNRAALNGRINGIAFVINGKAYVGFGDYGYIDWWEFTP